MYRRIHSRSLGSVAVAIMVLASFARQAAASQCQGLKGLARMKCELTQRIGSQTNPLPTPNPEVILQQYVNEVLNRPSITTGFADARYDETLPETFSPGWFLSFGALGRTPEGSLLLRPGAYEGVVQSYCLHAGTFGPSKGTGYCPAPLRGPKAELVRSILRASALHPEVHQHDIQLLLWAIIARADYEHMPPQLQQTATALLSQEQLEQLNGGLLSQVPVNLRLPFERKLEQEVAKLTAPLQRVALAENKIRQQMAGSATYEAIEATAVLTAVLSEQVEPSPIQRGIWVRHPQGYYVRYLPEGYARTRIQIFVPKSASAIGEKGVVVPVSYPIQASAASDMVFDPTEEIAVPANTGSQRLAMTSRAANGDSVPSCPAMYVSVAAGDELVPRPPIIADVPQMDFWNLFWAMFERSPVGVFVAGIFTPSQIADDELAGALRQCPPVTAQKPTRTCSDEVFADLSSQQERLCSLPSRCSGPTHQEKTDPAARGAYCARLLGNIDKFQACINIRQRVMDECYGGGDDPHKAKIQELKDKGLQKCAEFYSQNCGEPPIQ